jgi:uncharacterized membrane protein
MITNPWLLGLALAGLVAAILKLEKHPLAAPVTHYLPGAFWCYFIPMVLSTAGLLPEDSPTYNFLTTYVLSGCLILLLLDVNLPGILRLGPTALGAMTVGALGIAVGAVVAFALFAHWLPPETWKGVGALSASWIGGSANMLAVKEGLRTPDNIFAPMVIVDTVITYSWMGILVALAVFQDRWDRWVGADRKALEDVVKRLESGDNEQCATRNGSTPSNALRTTHHALPIHAVWLIGGSMLIGWVCLRIGDILPPLGDVLNPSGWAFLLVTLIGILLSLTPASNLERYGASKWGYLCLYLLLAAMGSKARFQYILKAPLLILMAYIWVLIHAFILATYGYLLKTPMFFLATSSQANIGGTASTPIVAGVYQPRLAALGLLLAIAGNVIGTYCGFLIAQACHWVHP